MPDLALAAKLFAGSIVHFALEASGTSDLATRPASNSALWLNIPGINSCTHKHKRVVEEYDEVDANRGWSEGKDEYTTADIFEIKTRYTAALFEQLRYGLAGAVVQGTAQTPFVKADRKVRGWLNVQQRMSNGQDRTVLSVFVELRAMDPPADEKKTQEPMFEAWVLFSSLNSFVLPT
jgi:hypothetical protein